MLAPSGFAQILLSHPFPHSARAASAPSPTGSLRPCLVPKNFQDSLSHRIFGHMHRVLNVVLKNNQLYNLTVNDEINLLNLIRP